MLIKTASAGTLESSDILIQLEPSSNGIEIYLESAVIYQFGDQIRAVIAETLHEAGVKSARVKATDRGALDCTIKARVLTAVMRSMEISENKWRVYNGTQA